MAGYSPDKSNIAAVCGNELRIYGRKEENDTRPLLKTEVHPSHGHAKLEAEEYDERQKAAALRREG